MQLMLFTLILEAAMEPGAVVPDGKTTTMLSPTPSAPFIPVSKLRVYEAAVLAVLGLGETVAVVSVSEVKEAIVYFPEPMGVAPSPIRAVNV